MTKKKNKDYSLKLAALFHLFKMWARRMLWFQSTPPVPKAEKLPKDTVIDKLCMGMG